MRPITESMRRLVAAEERAQLKKDAKRPSKRRSKRAKRKQLSYCKLLDKLHRKRMLRSVFDAECH